MVRYSQRNLILWISTDLLCIITAGSGLKPLPVTRKINHDAEFENRAFRHHMNPEGVFLKELADEKIVEKAFDNIDRFNEKYRI